MLDVIVRTSLDYIHGNITVRINFVELIYGLKFLFAIVPEIVTVYSPIVCGLIHEITLGSAAVTAINDVLYN